MQYNCIAYKKDLANSPPAIETIFIDALNLFRKLGSQ
jgi:hypothetical protein